MMLRPLCLLLVLSLTSLAHAKKPDESGVEWMKVLLQGQQIGHVEQSRRVVGDTVIHSERFEARFARAGTTLDILTEETHRESTAGVPLGFSTLTDLAGSAQHSEGVIAADGGLSLIFKQGKSVRTENARYPAGALLSEGADLLEKNSKMKPGDVIRFQSYVPSQMAAVNVSLHYIGDEDIDIDGKTVRARHSEQTLDLPGGAVTLNSWTDGDGRMLRSVMPMFGMELEMIASDRQSAAHRDDATDLFALTVVAAPRALTAEDRRHDLRYSIRLADSNIAASVPAGEQQLQADGNQWSLQIDVPPYAHEPDTNAPDAAALRSSNWVQSDAPELIKFAKAAVDDERNAQARMQLLQTAVSQRINDKNLRVGYASALEALRMREGDCTEHALLLAAAGRALGIPTRVAVGLAYVDQFSGHQQAFVPHAWVQSWIEGRWVSFDAALGGFDSGHIALATGDGDPATFFGSINLLGNLKISAIERVTP